MKGPKLLIWGLAAVVLLALGIALTRPAAATKQDIGNQQLRDLQARGVRIVDVRSSGEYAMGHIAGAENVPVEQITSSAGSWDKTQAIVVYCASGARSLNAAQYLVAQGFTKVYNLTQGVSAWDGQLTKDTAAATGPTGIKTNGKPILIDFYSDTWPVCIKMKPVVDGLMQRYQGKVEYRRLNANDPSTQQLADTFGVQYVPTFVFIDSKGNRVDQVVGETTADALAKKLDSLK